MYFGQENHRGDILLFSMYRSWVVPFEAMSFSRGSSRPRDRTWVSCIAGRRFNLWATREARRAVLKGWVFSEGHQQTGRRWTLAVKTTGLHFTGSLQLPAGWMAVDGWRGFGGGMPRVQWENGCVCVSVCADSSTSTRWGLPWGSRGLASTLQCGGR